MDQVTGFRALPRVDDLYEQVRQEFEHLPRRLVITEIRRALESMRAEIRATGTAGQSAEIRLRQSLSQLLKPSIRSVVNATGVVLHTNMGRSPLPDIALISRGYSNIECDVTTGKRKRRDDHLTGLLEIAVGAPGMIVNNNAAAVYLALRVLAAGYEVIVSRGELVEIGDGFRIPDIMQASGSMLREVGTTNRTHIRDYAQAITDRTRLLLRVHRSNFSLRGFVAQPSLAELVALGRSTGIPVYEDLGSGCLVDLSSYGVIEPLASDSLAAGVDLISFSGDKLLGGPQAGILAGRKDLLARLRADPMFRTFRVG